MGLDTDFYTSRRYTSSRPVVSSYTVSYPALRYSTGSTRTYSTSYPIYSSYSSYKSLPYASRKRVVTGSRIITSPVRIITSPVRVITSPIRVITSSVRPSSYITSRIITSPARVYTAPTPRIRFYRNSLTPTRIVTSPIRTLPSVLNKEIDRIQQRIRPGFGNKVLNDYINSESYTTFNNETRRIRQSTETMMKELHAPVVRRSRSTTPFVSAKYEPSTALAFDSYVNRITNPMRHVAQEVHMMSHYAEPARKYVGKSHLASIRICGNKAYDVRRPQYDSDKVRNDINLMSYYLRYPQARSSGKSYQKSLTTPVDAVEAI